MEKRQVNPWTWQADPCGAPAGPGACGHGRPGGRARDPGDDARGRGDRRRV